MRRKRQDDEAFQMAPMIDMVFLLLVFFMTVSTIAREARPEVELPLTLEASVPVERDPLSVLTLHTSNGQAKYIWFNREIGSHELDTVLQEDTKAGAVSLTVRAAADYTWADLEPVLQSVRRAGYESWILCGFEGGS